MSNDFQSELNHLKNRFAEIQNGQQDLKDRFAKIESEHRAAKSAILDHQAQLDAEALRLANLCSLCSALRSDLERSIAVLPDRESSQ
jgi:chromosome segregation ATPase